MFGPPRTGTIVPPANATFDEAQRHPLDSPWWRSWAHRGHGRRSKRGKSGKRRKGGGAAGGGSGAAGGNGAAGRLYCVQQPGMALYLPTHWAHGTIALEESLGVGGFLRDAGGLGLHMQLLHAPRGIGSLQTAIGAHREWYARVARAFPAGDPRDFD